VALRSLQAFPPARNKPEVRWAGAAAQLNPNPPVARPVPPAARPYNSPDAGAPKAAGSSFSASTPRAAAHAAPNPRAAAPAAPAAFDPNTLKVAALLLVAPPAGVFLMWSLPSYPREGKVAASVAGLVWMMIVGVAFAAWLA
jgi:hypothetical protein